MSRGSIIWDKLVSIILAIIVLFFLVVFIYFVYLKMTKTELPWLI